MPWKLCLAEPEALSPGLGVAFEPRKRCNGSHVTDCTAECSVACAPLATNPLPGHFWVASGPRFNARRFIDADGSEVRAGLGSTSGPSPLMTDVARPVVESHIVPDSYSIPLHESLALHLIENSYLPWRRWEESSSLWWDL